MAGGAAVFARDSTFWAPNGMADVLSDYGGSLSGCSYNVASVGGSSAIIPQQPAQVVGQEVVDAVMTTVATGQSQPLVNLIAGISPLNPQQTRDAMDLPGHGRRRVH